MAGQPAQDGLIFVLNSGSSSLKFGVYARRLKDEEPQLFGSADGIGHENGALRLCAADGKDLLKRDGVLETQDQALKTIADATRERIDGTPVAVGHRVVHGGPHLVAHERITPKVMEQLEAAVHFAPLHLPQALSLIRSAQRIFPNAAHFACFDSVFHRTMPEIASHLPLPQRYFDAGVRRYGFHGLSYESLVYRLGAQLPARAIFAHLGNGASLCAVLDGKSIDTTMGLTPTGGIPMGTRTGDLDPGVFLYLLRTEKPSVDDLEKLVNKQSGLAGLSGGESDVKALQDRMKSGNAPATLTLNIFATAVQKTIGAYIALLGGIDLLVFTGGIGEHSDFVRNSATKGLESLGLTAEKIKVMPAQEEQQIARHCRRLLEQTA